MLDCAMQAAITYDVPANVLIAVAEIEGGRDGQWARNKNGTFDVGPLQFNTGYLRSLSEYGVEPQDVEGGNCYPYDLAAWRIAGHIRSDPGEFWSRIANYHSRTPVLNARYRRAVLILAAKWGAWLRAHVATREFVGKRK